jgi:hypothetical protein
MGYGYSVLPGAIRTGSAIFFFTLNWKVVNNMEIAVDKRLTLCYDGYIKSRQKNSTKQTELTGNEFNACKFQSVMVEYL